MKTTTSMNITTLKTTQIPKPSGQDYNYITKAEIVLTCICSIIATVSNFLVIMQFCLIYTFRNTNTSLFIFTLACFDFANGLISMPINVIFSYYEHLMNYGEGMFLNETGPSCVAGYLFKLLPGYCAINLLLIMAIDRCIAVNFPFWYEEHVQRNQIRLAICVHLSYHLYFVVSFFGLYHHIPGTSCDSFKRTPDDRGMPDWWVGVTFIGIKANLAVSVLLWIQSLYITAKVKNRELSKITCNVNQNRERSLLIQCPQVVSIRIVASLLFSYIILYLPATILDIMKASDIDSDDPVYKIYVSITKVLMHINACVNMFVYAAVKPSNRQAYLWMLSHRPWHWSQMEVAMRERRGSEWAASAKGNTRRGSTAQNISPQAFYSNSSSNTSLKTIKKQGEIRGQKSPIPSELEGKSTHLENK